jgi:hypothetical protein
MATVRTPFTDTGIQRKVVSEQITLVGWSQAPLLKRLGWENERKWKFNNWPPGASKKMELLQDTVMPTTDTLAKAITSTSSTTVEVTNPDYWQVGSVFKVGNEYMTVTDKATSGVLTVARASGGSTASTHSAAAAMTRITIAKTTGANYAIGYTTTMTLPYNYTQILETSVRVNRDQQIAGDYGVPDTMAYHLAKAIGGRSEVGQKGRAGSLTLELARIAYHSLRQAPSATQPGIAGGLGTFITTNTYGGTTTALSRATIHEALRDVYEAGSMADILVVSPYGAELISEMYEGTIRTERSEERGGSVIKYIETPNSEGEIEIVRDWMCPGTEMWLLDSEKVGWMTIRPFSVEEKPSLGDYDVMSVLGEYSFIVADETSHAKIQHTAAS